MESTSQSPPQSHNDLIQTALITIESLREANSTLHRENTILRSNAQELEQRFQDFNIDVRNTFSDSVSRLDTIALDSAAELVIRLRDEHNALQREHEKTEADIRKLAEIVTMSQKYLGHNFPRFPELPKELQLSIWQFALAEPQIIPIGAVHTFNRQIPFQFFPMVRHSPLLGVNRETRNEAKKVLQSWIYMDRDPKIIPLPLRRWINVNPVHDVVWIHDHWVDGYSTDPAGYLDFTASSPMHLGSADDPVIELPIRNHNFRHVAMSFSVWKRLDKLARQYSMVRTERFVGEDRVLRLVIQLDGEIDEYSWSNCSVSFDDPTSGPKVRGWERLRDWDSSDSEPEWKQFEKDFNKVMRKEKEDYDEYWERMLADGVSEDELNHGHEYSLTRLIRDMGYFEIKCVRAVLTRKPSFVR
ncbi:hypothetical protein PVAG01_07552 [Phlyctema vagabunda]|uniref:2EXR domain-containing protein n=1 Tax=Phlyctema vagabunda TaxID=108571 RepID=A0ABR4PCR4_9HELO